MSRTPSAASLLWRLTLLTSGEKQREQSRLVRLANLEQLKKETHHFKINNPGSPSILPYDELFEALDILGVIVNFEYHKQKERHD